MGAVLCSSEVFTGADVGTVVLVGAVLPLSFVSEFPEAGAALLEDPEERAGAEVTVCVLMPECLRL